MHLILKIAWPCLAWSSLSLRPLWHIVLIHQIINHRITSFLTVLSLNGRTSMRKKDHTIVKNITGKAVNLKCFSWIAKNFEIHNWSLATAPLQLHFDSTNLVATVTLCLSTPESLCITGLHLIQFHPNFYISILLDLPQLLNSSLSASVLTSSNLTFLPKRYRLQYSPSSMLPINQISPFEVFFFHH